ncbi:hypothetical protein [Caulobacter vibrioides]|uniref:hypothetical protein n=1 Tax=Caulobacter vibrioides TaxID=155892 RepID=UPI000F73994F|nr:hypothetical protein [Caulobacter vibrioides]
MQWLYAVAIAMVLAALLQLLGTLFANLVKRHSPETKIVMVARFIAFFIFFLYSAARTIAPGLDRHIPPAAFVFGWVIVGGVALHLLSEAQTSKKPSTSSEAEPPTVG